MGLIAVQAVGRLLESRRTRSFCCPEENLNLNAIARLKVLAPLLISAGIAEGNDPPAGTVVEAENRINQKRIRILINSETVSRVAPHLREASAPYADR